MLLFHELLRSATLDSSAGEDELRHALEHRIYNANPSARSLMLN
jgi:hypothetical protein